MAQILDARPGTLPAAGSGVTGEGPGRPPRISVVVANYNGARHLGDALRTVLAQSLGDFELLVSDDASTDDSPALVERMARDDPRIRLLRAPRNGGPAAARNRALDAARGTWIAVVDGDDLLHPDRLCRLIEQAEADGADLAADDLLVFDDAGAVPPHRLLGDALGEAPRWVEPADYVRSNAPYAAGPALGYLKPVIRREALRARGLRYDETLRIAEDSDLVLRLMLGGARFRLYPGLLTYFYRKHSGSISHRRPAAVLEAMIAANHAPLRDAPADLAESARAPVAAALGHAETRMRDEMAFNGLVSALKARRPVEAARAAMARPAVARPLFGALRDRLRRLAAKGRAGAPAPAERRAVIVTRQRVVGRNAGSTTYLLGLAESLRDAGWTVDLVCPSPATLGRWPVLKLAPEMSVFRSIRMRGARRQGNAFLAEGPGIWTAAALGVADRLLRKAGAPGLGRLAANAPYAVATPWTAADFLFVAEHARGADLLLADYAFTTPALPYALTPGAPSAVVMHDLFSARPMQFAKLGGAAQDSVALLSEPEEAALLGAADAVIAIQCEEAAAVRRLVPPDRTVLTAPMAIEPVAAPAPGEDDLVFFVGSNTAPNVDGLRWFLAECWPAVRAARPAARLQVAGAVAHAVAERPEGVEFLGRVPDLAPAYARAGVVISPLRAGSGLKIKLVEALGHGKAVVCTTTTLQGVEAQAAPAVVVTDEAAAFAAELARLLGDRDARAGLAARALDAARDHFSAAACFGPVLDWAASRAPPRG